jgi:hypothetical protein
MKYQNRYYQIVFREGRVRIWQYGRVRGRGRIPMIKPAHYYYAISETRLLEL